MSDQTSYQPLISVIMNCYNGEKYLREAIDSVYAQTYKNWEIIFFDNGSIDNSAEIANSYNSKIKYFYYEKKILLGVARQMAVDKSTGEWIANLDTDDLWYPDRLKVQLDAVNNSDFVMCYAGIHDIEQNGAIIREYLPHYNSGYMFEQQLFQFEVNNVTPLIRKNAMYKHNIFFEPRMTSGDDYNLYMRLMAKGRVCTIPVVLGAWRIYPGTVTDRTIKHWSEERFFTLDQIKKENPDFGTRYIKAFGEARARGIYYNARYLVKTKNFKEARVQMNSISMVSKKYFMLYLLTFIPLLWNYVHSSIIKRKLSLKILGY